MGANASTAVPVYASGEVLDAARLNLTNAGIPVFADSSARDAAFGGTGEKTLAEGQFAYLEDTNATQYYDGSTWQAVGGASGLTLVSATTIGSAVASVTVSGAFSATYDNYKILLSGGALSTNDNLTLQFGATTTGYYAGYSRVTYPTAAAALSTDNNAASFTKAGVGSANGLNMVLDVLSPNLAKNTFISGSYINNITVNHAGAAAGFLNDTTVYTAFTITPVTGTLTGGIIRVYGYANS